MLNEHDDLGTRVMDQDTADPSASAPATPSSPALAPSPIISQAPYTPHSSRASRHLDFDDVLFTDLAVSSAVPVIAVPSFYDITGTDVSLVLPQMTSSPPASTTSLSSTAPLSPPSVPQSP